jgi:hypothetical protein
MTKVFSARAVSVDKLGVRLGPDEEFAQSSLHGTGRLVLEANQVLRWPVLERQ